MIASSNWKEPFEYICRCDKDEHGEPVEGATVFVLRPEDKALHAKSETLLMDLHRKRKEDPTSEYAFAWEYLRIALMDIRNFFDADGNEVKIAFDENGLVTDDVIQRIHQPYRDEIVAAHRTQFDLTAEDRKN